MDNSDEAIWRRVLAGDAHSFGLIWDRHRNLVFGYLIRSGASSFDAEDLTAATFLELWRRRSSVRFVDGSLRAWLVVTARNMLRNAARARRRYERFLAALPPPVPETDHAELHADRHTPEIAVMRAAITKRGLTDAHLFAMTALEGFTVREAAAAVGLSESAAKMRLSRLRTGLRTDLASNPIEQGES